MTGFVYAIQSGDSVKIGWAKDPARRLSELNVGSPEKHILLGAARGTKSHEAEMHALCKDEHLRGEWFRKGRIVSLFIAHLPAFSPPVRAKGFSALDNYLAEKKITQTEFAALAGVTQSQISKLRSGKANPSFALLRRIEALTGGRIKPNDFLGNGSAR